jgi:hypothetical protein
MEFLRILGEILKYTVPAVVVFLTVYFIMRKYLDHQYNLQLAQARITSNKETLPLKLQAYERLALFCNRISIPNLILRLRTPEMTGKSLANAMLIAIQQELDHNVSQQVYISEQLWNILKLAKNHTVNSINTVGSALDEEATSSDFVDRMFEYLNSDEDNPLDTAASAIRKEVSTYV